jgi:DNA invertase Pin-like site-specific DNA recombinase
MTGAIIYIRVSAKEQTANLSLPTQLRACEEYCERQGCEVLARFSEWLGHTKLETTAKYLNMTTQYLHEVNKRKALTLVAR